MDLRPREVLAPVNRRWTQELQIDSLRSTLHESQQVPNVGESLQETPLWQYLSSPLWSVTLEESKKENLTMKNK
jgi:hypothetical protein